MNPTDKLMAWAQIWLSVLFILGTFVVIGLYELGYTHFTSDQDKAFSSTMNWLTGACLIIVYFWFQRQRTAGIADPGQLVTQTHTAPDGTKTIITSPAATTAVPNTSGVPPHAEILSQSKPAPPASTTSTGGIP